MVLLILHCNYLHNYTCSDLHYSTPRCIIKTSDPTQLHFNIDVKFSSSSSITKKIFIWIFLQEELFFFVLPTACTECWYLALLLLSGLPYFTCEPHIIFFPPNFHVWEKKIEIIKMYIPLILIISLDRMSYLEQLCCSSSTWNSTSHKQTGSPSFV